MVRPSESDLCSIHQVAILRSLPEATLLHLIAGATVLEPRNKALVFAEGDPSDAVYAILSGTGLVRIGVADQRSKGLMFAIYRKNDFFGEIGGIDGMPRTATAVVNGRVKLLRIRRESFLEVLNNAPSLGLALSLSLAQRLRRTNTLLQDATFEPLEARLARQLVYLAQIDSRAIDGGLVLGMRMNQSDMADLLGTTNRSIIAILNKWRAARIVHFDALAARLTICNEMALNELCKSLD